LHYKNQQSAHKKEVEFPTQKPANNTNNTEARNEQTSAKTLNPTVSRRQGSDANHKPNESHSRGQASRKPFVNQQQAT